MANRYTVELTTEERKCLLEMIAKNKTKRAKLINAYILLKSDTVAEGEGWICSRISKAYNVSESKIKRTKKRFVEEGFESALNRKPASNYKPRKLQGDEEAYLIATCCSDPPEGRVRWTLNMLSNKLVEMKYVESISLETVRQTLKKTNLNPGRKKNGAFHQ